MTPRLGLFAGFLSIAALVGLNCTDDTGNGSGNPGMGGSSGGSAGSGAGGGAGSGGTAGSGGATGGSSGTPGFMSIAPCQNESDYVTGSTTIDFGTINGAYAYSPKCLKITIPRGMLGTAGAPGTNVTFSGDFGTHPLEPSALRGSQTGNPITPTSSVPDGGTSKTFRFETPGYFAYFCQVHNPSDNGAAMSGVIWATSE